MATEGGEDRGDGMGTVAVGVGGGDKSEGVLWGTGGLTGGRAGGADSFRCGGPPG